MLGTVLEEFEPICNNTYLDPIPNNHVLSLPYDRPNDYAIIFYLFFIFSAFFSKIYVDYLGFR